MLNVFSLSYCLLVYAAIRQENYEIHLWLEALNAYFKKSLVLAFLQTWEIIIDLLQRELRNINIIVNHVKKYLPASLAFGLHKNPIE